MMRESMRRAIVAVDRSPALAMPTIGVSRRAIVETFAGEWGLEPEERLELHLYADGEWTRREQDGFAGGPAAA